MTPEARYPHPNPNVARVADCDDITRLAYLRRDRFVPHERAKDILADWEMLLDDEDAVRAQGRLLAGDSLMGKSTIVEEFMARHRADDNPNGEAAIVPVVRVQFPDLAREGIFPEILASLNVRFSANAKSQYLRHTTLDLLRRVGMRLLIIDEFHNILEGSASAQRRALNSMKYLMNDLRRPIICVGTKEVVQAVNSDEQISSRLRPLLLDRFYDDEHFQLLLDGFEALIPLRKASSLAEPGMSTLIFQHTLGVTGKVSDLLNDAAKMAIKEGIEQITPELVESARWPERERILARR